MRGLGIDLRGPVVRVVALERAGRDVRVLGSERGPAPADPALADWLDTIARRLTGAEPESVASTLSGAVVTHRIFELPFTDQARLTSVVPFELEDALPCGLEDGVVTFSVLARDSAAGASRVLAAFARRDALSAHLDLLGRARLDPAVVDVGLLALAGLLSPPAQGTNFVVASGPDGGVLLFCSGVLAGAYLVPDDSEEARRWAVLTLANGLEREAEPPSLATIGPPTGEITAAIGARAQPLANLTPAWAATLGPDDLCAAALALHALEPRGTGTNFRSGDFAYHAPSEEARRQVLRTAAFASAAAIAALIALVATETTRSAELTRLRREIAGATSSVLPNAAPGTEVRRLRAAVESLAGRRDRLAGSGERAMLDVLAALGNAVPVGAPLQIDDVTIDEASVRLHGRTDTYEAVDVAKRAFEGISGQATPEVRDVKTSLDGRVEFRATIPLGAGAR